MQCDQIGQFIVLWATIQSLLATINLPKYPTFLGNFCKGVKIINFSNEIIFGQLLLTFGNFLCSHWGRGKLQELSPQTPSLPHSGHSNYKTVKGTFSMRWIRSHFRLFLKRVKLFRLNNHWEHSLSWYYSILITQLTASFSYIQLVLLSTLSDGIINQEICGHNS